MASNGNYNGANGNGSDSGNGGVNGNAATTTTSHDSAAGNADAATVRALRITHLEAQAAVTTTVPVVQAGVSAFDTLQVFLAQAQVEVSAAKAKDATIASLHATITQLQAEAETAKAATATALATVTQLQAEAATANAATATATATATVTVQKMVEQFECGVCHWYVPVKGYGLECLAGHATCAECSKPHIEYGANDDGSDDIDVPLPNCPICRRAVSAPFQCEFYFRMARELVFDCRLEHGGCG